MTLPGASSIQNASCPICLDAYDSARDYSLSFLSVLSKLHDGSENPSRLTMITHMSHMYAFMKYSYACNIREDVSSISNLACADHHFLEVTGPKPLGVATRFNILVNRISTLFDHDHNFCSLGVGYHSDVGDAPLV
jgi:hypothetical protein